MQCSAASPLISGIGLCLLLKQNLHIADSLFDMVRAVTSTNVLDSFYQNLQDKAECA